MIILLDSGVLSILASPLKDISETDSEIKDNTVYDCNQWFYTNLAKGISKVVS